MKLPKIIQQLNEKDYSLLVQQFTETKADKYLLLLKDYRIGKREDKAMAELLDVSPSAFYTLKSRLQDKVQDFLFKKTNETRVELLKNVANIEHLIYNTPRETAIGMLKKLESELLENDMPNELITVYKALKKLHLYSPKYYDYSQLYNKYVAFNLAQDKAEETLSIFCKTLSSYYLTRDPEILNILILYKKEMQNYCRLYESHHLNVYKNILNIHFSLFCTIETEMKEDAPIEEMLKESLSIMEKHSEDRTYKHLIKIIYFLHFEYYQQLKLYKNAAIYFEKITKDFETLLLLNHSCFTSHFLISKIEYALVNQEEKQLYADSEIGDYEPNIENVPELIIFNYYRAATAFYVGQYLEAIQILNRLLTTVSFKNILFIETEIKLIMSLCYILAEKKGHVEMDIRSVLRKITYEDRTQYQSVFVFIKLLKVAVRKKTTDKYKKILEINEAFNTLNKGRYRILDCIKLEDVILKQLAR